MIQEVNTQLTSAMSEGKFKKIFQIYKCLETVFLLLQWRKGKTNAKPERYATIDPKVFQN